MGMAFNVLIVDDSLPMRSVIRKTLEMSGFSVGQVFEASNGIEALKVLREHWLDIVLTDFNMPDMDGLQLIEEMKKDEILRTIPVVVITTEGSQKRLDQFREKGAAETVQKPFTPETIASKLNRILGESEDGEGSAPQGDEGLDF